MIYSHYLLIRRQEEKIAAFCSQNVVRRAPLQKKLRQLYAVVTILTTVVFRGTSSRELIIRRTVITTTIIITQRANEERDTDRDGVTLATGENRKIRKLAGG